MCMYTREVGGSARCHYQLGRDGWTHTEDDWPNPECVLHGTAFSMRDVILEVPGEHLWYS